MKSQLNEFKTFIARGNVVELAVGLIMALYFGAIVQSFVDDIVMPPIGNFIAGIDFADLKWVIGERVTEEGTIELISINYGIFLNTIITFLIVSLAIFTLVRVYNNFLKKEKKAASAAPNNQEKLLIEIRDILKENKRL
ncbi:MAG: large-conductance mechanosensitive channel protein MscL [Balneolales bacterium]